MGRFVEVERELNWTHSVGINTQYDFFYFGFMSTIVKQDVLLLYDQSTKRNCPDEFPSDIQGLGSYVYVLRYNNTFRRGWDKCPDTPSVKVYTAHWVQRSHTRIPECMVVAKVK